VKHGSEISAVKAELSTTISTEISTLSSETLRDIVDLSNILHSRIYHDISDVIGGAGESLDTLRELELFVTDLSDATVTALASKVADLSGRETAHYISLSTDIKDLSDSFNSDVGDLSSLVFNTLSTEISDLSPAKQARKLVWFNHLLLSEITDLSRIHIERTQSREISELSSDTSVEISDLSSLTFLTLSTEIADLKQRNQHGDFGGSILNLK
jgi:hypothetical protein